MINVPTRRPTTSTLAALAGLVWGVASGAVRDFVWADLRGGLIDPRGLARSTRALIWLGFTLLFLMIGALLYNDFWRALFPLVPLTLGPTGRGALVPLALVPATLFLLAMAWSFALAGALHSHWAIRLATLVFYVIMAASWTTLGVLQAADPLGLALSWGTVLGVLLVFAARWRARARPALEFLVLLLLVSATFALAQARGVETWRQSGVPVMLASLSAYLLSFTFLVTPLLLLIGLDIANFARQAAGWVADIATARLPARLVQGLLAAALVWRLRDVGLELADRIGDGSLQAQLAPYAGALGIPLLTALGWWLVAGRRRRAAEPLTVDGVSEAAESVAPKLVVAFLALPLLSIVLYAVILALLGAVGATQMDDLQGAVGLIGQLGSQASTWQTVLMAVLVPAAFWLGRRGRVALALYFAIFGLRGIWNELTALGRPLGGLYWDGLEPLDFWWVIIFAGFGLVWLVRGQLTAERAGRLLFLLLISALLRQTDFIENKFTIFGFAGIGFVAFGILWDALTIGSWANVGTPGLPRTSRIFLYLGYVLLTVTLINWVLTAHDLDELDKLTGETAQRGFTLLGRPLLYAIFALTLARPEESTAIREDAEAPDPRAVPMADQT